MMRALRDLLAFRGVLLALVWRDLKTRYRGSVLGFLWTFLNPFLLMAIYSLVFSVYMRIAIPAYPVFVFCGLLPWGWFASAMLSGTNSIIESGTLLKRVYFPPQVLPTVIVTATLVNFLLALPLLFAFLLYSRLHVTWAILLLPIPIAIQYVLTLGLTMVLSMLTVRYRDLYHLLANFMTLWFFLTPVLYPSSMVPQTFHSLLSLNPMTPLVMSFQDALYYGRPPSLHRLAAVGVVSLAILAAALVLVDRGRWALVEEV